MSTLSGAHNAFKSGAGVSCRLLIGSTFKIETKVKVAVVVKVGFGVEVGCGRSQYHFDNISMRGK